MWTLGKLPFDVVLESSIYKDAGYTDYCSEDDLFEAELIHLHARIQRKSNFKRKDELHICFIKQHKRKAIETTFPKFKVKMLKPVHTSTSKDF